MINDEQHKELDKAIEALKYALCYGGGCELSDAASNVWRVYETICGEPPKGVSK